MINTRKLLSWYDRHGRDLPWRRTRDPYRILVSEIMLQQTQVTRVLEFYQRWLKRFPTWRALAQATNHDVIAAWSGLGYNRRALMLRDIARQMTANRRPQTADQWMQLKGVGPYTANAVACFAFHERVLPIDTNIRRAAGRLLLGKPFPVPSDDARIRERAARYVRLATRFYDIPQALFDLATAVCKKKPDCAVCPMRNECPSAEKFLSGRVRIPKRTIQKATERIREGKREPDRIFRGRILELVMRSRRPLAPKEIGPAIDEGFDQARDVPWLKAMLRRMDRDGLIEFRRNTASKTSMR